MYEKRSYRETVCASGLVRFVVREDETDLLVLAERDLSDEVRESVRKVREVLTIYIGRQPGFASVLKPVGPLPDAPAVVETMVQAGYAAGVGPMAAVAGAIAEIVARDLADHSKEIIVENGGDVFMIGESERVVSIQAGQSPLTGKVGLRLIPGPEGLAVCTSSGTVGHSHSFGRADAAVTVAQDGALADAAATAVGNRVSDPDHIESALRFGMSVPGVLGVLVVVVDKLGALGKIELTEL